jgi:hypothetical protein
MKSNVRFSIDISLMLNYVNMGIKYNIFFFCVFNKYKLNYHEKVEIKNSGRYLTKNKSPIGLPDSNYC